MSFWERVSYSEPGECWLWTGAKNKDGYGHYRDERVHRIAYRLAKPSMFDPALHVLHACDTRACCRPSHLFQGTQADNNRDMYAKGRAVNPRGETHPRAKLTEEQVRAIRASSLPKKTLARMYGVSRSAIQFIKNGRNWRGLH